MNIIALSYVDGYENQLRELLQDCVGSGASVGFIAPIAHAEANSYWQDVQGGLANGTRKLWVAIENGMVVGAVQLGLCSKANGSHRGEVEKLMVHTSARGKGISKKLMASLEEVAVSLELLLLVLDTRLGDIASTLYRQLGYTEAGQIPAFARSSDGQLDATVLFYKQINGMKR